MGREQFQTVLDEYGKFLQGKDMAPAKHRPHLVRWVRGFLLFARGHGGYTFEQTLDMFLAEVAVDPADGMVRGGTQRRIDSRE